MSIIIVCVSLVLTNFQFPIDAFSNTDGPTFPLEVSTDKYYYTQGEEVAVTLTNVGDKTMDFLNPPSVQVKNSTGHIIVNHCPSVAQIVIPLAAGKSLTRRWDQKHFLCSHPGDPVPPNGEQVAPGKYDITAGSGNARYGEVKMPVADHVWIEISTGNVPPVADAGPDQTVNVGDTVQFNGSGSYSSIGEVIPIGSNMMINDEVSLGGVGGAPQVTMDSAGGSYVTWTDTSKDRGGILFDNASNLGLFGSDRKVAEYFSISSDITLGFNDEIHIAWRHTDIQYSMSTDGGLSFSSPVTISEEDTPAGTPVRIASGTDGSVHIVWASSPNSQVCYRSSSDGGKHWDPSIVVADGGHPDVVVSDDGHVYVTWQGLVEGSTNASILFSRKSPNGSFETPVPVHPIESFRHIDPSIAVGEDGEVMIVWVEQDEDKHRIVFTESTDNGFNFDTPVIVRAEKPVGAIVRFSEPAVAAFRSKGIAVAWIEYVKPFEPQAEARVSVSLDMGRNFSPYSRVDDYAQSGKRQPAIAGSPKGDLFSVWHDGRDCPSKALCGSNIYGVWLEVSSTPLRFSWDFGDGSPRSSDMNPTHVYSSPGLYNVTLTVSDENGLTDSDNCIITVISANQPPVADAGSDQSVHEGDTVLFDGTDSYDPDGGIEGWSTKTDIPSPRAGGGSATLNGEIYYVGGGPFDLVPEASSISQKYNPSTDTWSDLPDLPEPRAFLGVAAVNGRIYAIGGRSENQSTNTTYEFDPATNSWTSKAPVPIPIEAFGTAVVNDKIYLVGGWSTFVYCYPCAFVFEYNPSNDSWSQKPDIPTGRAKLAATVLDDKIFAIGGHPITVSHVVEVYDPATGEWSRRTNLTTGRWSLSAEVLGGNIYAFGGIVVWDLATDVNEMFDSSADSWVSKPSMLDIRMDFGSGVVGDCVYAIGGYSGFMAGHPNSSEEYCLDGELLYEWDFDASVDADGDGNHTNDVDATGPTPTHVYGDDGNYIVTLKVTDGTGKWDTDTCVITVNNLEPTITPFGPFIVDEGIPLTLEAVATDEGSDDLTFVWEFELGPAITNVYYNDGVGSDPYPSPWGTYPFTVTDTVQHTYGDDGVYSVRLTIVDDDLGTTIYETTVTVNNVAPTGGISGFFFVDEGSPMTFEATATDPGSDDLTFTWNWGDGTPDYVSIYYNDGIGPDPYPSPGGTYPFTATDTVVHTYGDNAPYTLTLTISDDDGSSVVYTTTVTVYNVAPTIEPFGPFTVDEGSPFTLEATATDPGSDDLTFAWEFELGSTITNVYYNDGVGPDPYPSPGGTYPFTATDTINYTYGDNGLYNVTLTVEDDDSGTTTYTTTIMVNNVAPTIEPFGPFVVDEGSQITAVATANDPGSDDLTFSWEFELGPTSSNTHYNDGIAPDPYPSPGGTYPFSATDSASHTYGDNYDYLLTLDVCDDDGGCTSYDTTVIANNVAPTIEPFGPFTVYEGTALDLIAISTDAGSDDLTFDWEFELGPTITEVYYNDGVGPDPYPSPGGTFPFSVADTVQHTYGDNGVFDVTLTVEDDDGGTATYTANITVNNVAPTIDVEAYILVNFTLRVAGEKWHNVELFIHEDGEEIGYAEVVRYPGSPDDQTATTGNLICDVTTTITAKVLYTPDDDPINGQINGANPAWVTLTFEDGSETRLKHTFNVKHPETWEWNIVVNPYIVGHETSFEATATDPGSDDLTFTWNWGDGTPDNETTYYNDGLGPDPYPSPGGTYPFSAMDGKKHTFTAAGEYTVTLTVTDDDGGVAVATVSINIP